MWVGGAIAALGMVSLLLGLIPLRQHSYWVGYLEAMRGGGLLGVFFGAVLVALSAGHLYTHFFDLKRRMSANHFGISLGIIIILTGVLATAVPSRLPTTPQEQLRKKDPKVAAKIASDQKRLKRMAALMIVVAGGVIAFYPSRRFFRR
jgi:hypothetical protein